MSWIAYGAMWGLSCRIRCSLAVRFGDNIRFGVPDAGQEMVETAARATHIHDYIESLPDKYDTIVDDDQNIFSTGQKQLISIARTLLTDPQVLIFG